MEPNYAALCPPAGRWCFCCRSENPGSLLWGMLSPWLFLTPPIQLWLLFTVVAGPRLFLSCPIDVDGSRVWFTDLWNYSIIPYLLEAVREGLQVRSTLATGLLQMSILVTGWLVFISSFRNLTDMRWQPLPCDTVSLAQYRDRLGCKSWLCHLLAVWPQASHLAPLSIVPSAIEKETSTLPQRIVARVKGNRDCNMLSTVSAKRWKHTCA